MLSVKQRGIKYHFWDFGMIQTEIEPWSIGKHSTDWETGKPMLLKKSDISLLLSERMTFIILFWKLHHSNACRYDLLTPEASVLSSAVFASSLPLVLLKSHDDNWLVIWFSGILDFHKNAKTFAAFNVRQWQTHKRLTGFIRIINRGTKIKKHVCPFLSQQRDQEKTQSLSFKNWQYNRNALLVKT